MTGKTSARQMLIGGKWVKCDSVIEVKDPQDHSLIDIVPAATARDACLAVEKAREGAKIAQEMSVHERMSILNRTADQVEEEKERFARTIAREGSKTIKEARKEVFRCMETLRISAEEARRINGETIAFDQMPGNENRIGYYYYFPVGIVTAITPFNDPLNLVAHKVGPAIASGNAIIVKPASATPLSALLLAEAFIKAGLPPEVLSVVTGYGSEIGRNLVTHPYVGKVSFTGGLHAGTEITRIAGPKKVSMELGSNSPVIVLEDANLNRAVESSVSGAFSAAGQNCIGVQRIYVEDAVFEDFLDQFVQKTLTLRVGDKMSEDTDMGPMINEDEAKRVELWVDEAASGGARILCGGKREGSFYLPTVLTDVPEQSRLFQEEAFGPVVSIEKVSGLKEAIDQSNRANYGLHAGIFTNNVQKAFYAIRQLEVGGVMINDSSDFRIDSMPFGGTKSSGVGREGVKFAIEDMTEKKVVCFNI